MSWLTSFLLRVLETISEVVGSYGLGIIIVTVLLRLLLYPLTISQTKRYGLDETAAAGVK